MSSSAATTSNLIKEKKVDNVLKVSKRVNVRRKPTDHKKVFDHYIFNTHYVLYVMELYNGKTIAGTEYELRASSKLIKEYKSKLTNQRAVDEEAPVESILTHRMVDGRPIYLVQWEGYPSPVWNSELWEDQLPSCCAGLLIEYKAMVNLQ